MSRTHLQRVFTTIGGLALAGTLALAQAAPVLFDVPLTGTQEVPAVQTPGQGNAALTYDASTRVVAWNITFSGLSSPATMAHFHGPAPVGKNAGVKLGLSHKGSTGGGESPSAVRPHCRQMTPGRSRPGRCTSISTPKSIPVARFVARWSCRSATDANTAAANARMQVAAEPFMLRGERGAIGQKIV